MMVECELKEVCNQNNEWIPDGLCGKFILREEKDRCYNNREACEFRDRVLAAFEKTGVIPIAGAISKQGGEDDGMF